MRVPTPSGRAVDRRRGGRCTWFLALGVTGCGGPQSALDPAGPAAAAIGDAWWLMFWGGCVVLAAVMALLLYAVYRAPARRARLDAETFVVVAGMILTPLLLAALLVFGTGLVARLSEPAGAAPLQIEVTGHQWWWEVRYPAPDEGSALVAANQIHIPAGRPVELALRSGDVIHSFWVPRLAGKLDLIPGRTNRLRLRADAPGRYSGQCAEFCGLRHAHMRFEVIAHSDPEFRRWLAQHARPALAGRADLQPFLERGCNTCHAIRGTAAAGVRGPDLTHFAARRSAARDLHGGTERLALWLRGTHTPDLTHRGERAAELSHQESLALARLLESLQ